MYLGAFTNRQSSTRNKPFKGGGERGEEATRKARTPRSVGRSVGSFQ